LFVPIPATKTFLFLSKAIPNTIMNTVDVGHRCFGTDFNMNRLAIRVIQPPTSSHIVYLDPKGKLIDRVTIPLKAQISCPVKV
jgi:hypothetical protein